MDKIFSLPNDLDLNLERQVHIYDYMISTSNFKNRINLTTNVISFLVEGQKGLVTSQDSLIVDNSKFLIMKKGHCLMTENISASNKIYKSILLFFTDEIASKIINRYSNTTYQEGPNPNFISCQYDRYTRSFVDSLIDISALSQASQNNILPLKLEELILYLVETKGSEFLKLLSSNKSEKTRNFLDTVESNKYNKLTLKELAFLSHMSISTFKREFVKHFKLSPIKWFQNQRLEHAAYLLKHKSMRPSDIYEEIGYETLSNFISAFKNKFEVTPKQYQSI